MKKSDELRIKTRKMIAKNLIILVVLAVVAFVGAFSWFTNHTSASANGINITAKVNDNLEYYIMPPSDSDQYSAINARLAANVAPERKEWHRGDWTFDYDDQELRFMKGLFLSDVTGDGATFSLPILMQYDEVAYVNDQESSGPATANNEYMSFDIYFRCKHQYGIKLMSDSSITPATALTAGTYHHPEDNYKDAAIGAVRMALYNGSVRQLLWIPGPDVYYNGLPDSTGQGPNGEDTLYVGLTEQQYANKGSVYYTGSGFALRQNEGTNDHAYYTANNVRQVISHTASGMYAGSEFGDDLTVVDLNNNGNDGYYYGHVRINLWIEGEDAEARLNFVHGRFNMALRFDIVDNAQSGQ